MKLGRQLNAFRGQSILSNTSAINKVFNSFIRANLNCFPLAWIHWNKTNLCRVENVQEKDIRLAHPDKMSTHHNLPSRANVFPFFTFVHPRSV